MSSMKAYIVSDDEGSVVRYAKHAVTARRAGAYELDEDFSYVTCRRAPQYDAMYPHGPTDLEMFQTGWYFECSLCSFGRAECDGGMHSDGKFYCENCVDGFTEMRPIDTPRSVEDFFGATYRPGPDGKWSMQEIPTSKLPIPNNTAWTPYLWFNPF